MRKNAGTRLYVPLFYQSNSLNQIEILPENSMPMPIPQFSGRGRHSTFHLT
jgi:hypothetical protein